MLGFWRFADLFGVILAKNAFGLLVGSGFLWGSFSAPEDWSPQQRRWNRALCLLAAAASYGTSLAGIVNGTSYWRK